MAPRTRRTIEPGLQARRIPGFPGYRICSDGTVWSCLARYGTRPWHRRRRSRSRDGGLTVTLQQNDRCTSHRVAGLVLKVFVGPRPAGHIVGYRDGNKLNCRLDNLQWVPRSGSAK